MKFHIFTTKDYKHCQFDRNVAEKRSDITHPVASRPLHTNKKEWQVLQGDLTESWSKKKKSAQAYTHRQFIQQTSHSNVKCSM